MIASEDSFNFPSDQVYGAFGDGSETPAGVFYGFVLTPRANIDECRRRITSVKQRYGDPSAPLHCRELFACHARAKSRWAHLSEEAAVTLCGDILRETVPLDLKMMIMHIPREHFPKRFRLKGKFGAPDIVHDVDAKWMLLWAFLRLAGHLDPEVINPPPDAIKFPRARTLPFWDLINVRSQSGPTVHAVIIDQEDTKIRWFSKAFMWSTVARHVLVDGPKGLSRLPITSSSRGQEPMLELADIFIYSNARVLSGGRPLEYSNFEGVVDLVILGHPCEEIVMGPNP